MAYWGRQNSQPPEQQQSKFNAGVRKIARMDRIWYNVHRHIRSGDLTSLKWELDIAWAELEADASDDHVIELGKMDKDILIAEKEPSSSQKKAKMYRALMAKWIFLFRIEKTQGWRTAYHNPMDEELD